MNAQVRNEGGVIHRRRRLVELVLMLLVFAGVGWGLSNHEDKSQLQAIIGRADLDDLMVERRSWQPSTLSDLEMWFGADWLFQMTRQTVEFQARGPAVDDARLHLIVGLRNLESLTLWDARISDAAISELSALPRLRSVDFSGTPLTDAGLAQLARVSSLKSVILSGTKVSKAGIAKLHEALPACRIEGPEYVAPPPCAGTCGNADDFLNQTVSEPNAVPAKATFATQ
jgi:hypothetical protein